MNPDAARQAVAIKPHKRSYEVAITLQQGETVRITKEDMWDDVHLWVWCISESGGEGWVPATFIDRNGEAGIAKRDYSAMELTISAGDTLTLFEEESGWHWAKDSHGDMGWVPVSCFADSCH